MSQDGPGDSDPRAPVSRAPAEGDSRGSPATRTESEGATVDFPEGVKMFTPGQVLGDRYQILEMLGKGGIGEVWHAFDLKLRVEVALKALREDFIKNERRLEMLRQEVRAAREVMSPNVCRIFDLIEAEGRELVSMEYIDGATLLDVLQDRGPLELKDAQEIASQFLAGLEAIHQVGLVHRDVKPENIMLTRSGRVVVMDFGLARQEDSGAGTVAGTPAYMSPEQAAGLQVDARADVFSAGVVLAEMVSPEGIRSFESRQSLWESVRSEPVKVPDTPWAPVVKKAVAKEREARYNSAHTLIRALEDRTFRVEGAEDLHPYPGLASFTEEDAEYFFGREAEVEQMWRKLERPHLLGIVGPSGSGKSSFIRAGLIPSAESGWSFLTCTPGNAAFRSLRQALASELAGDAEAMRELVDVDDLDAMVSAVSRWRARHDQAVLVVDQFEELFTLNPGEVQARFTELLGRLVLEADVFVLLSMRDDFFFLCHEFEALKPLVTDLTLLGPPAGAALRRALVQPAMKCGYRFEDDDLVDEMLAEVEGERGALPLLAFSMSRLWDKREREEGLLTRQAYLDIGGVGGALARHAEATIDRIGSENLQIVRELFRNLITAEGTRAVREWNELLSIFHDSRGESRAEEVLRQLIDARLLTSYEIREEDEAPTRRVEIIHESLLANWPRLVRWQTQDQEGARLRDELRQAARSWDEHGRHDDRLWAGTAYREYQLWRERYAGGLTEIEEKYARAMTSLATRRQRRRRMAFAAGIASLLAVLAVVTVLWQRSVQETRRAEAVKLLTLGEQALVTERTGALAYAITGLGLADMPETRRLALEALWAGPPATVVPSLGFGRIAFSPDGRYLVRASSGVLQILSRDGGPTVTLLEFEGRGSFRFSFSADSRLLVASANRSVGEVRVWETESWREIRVLQVPGVFAAYGFIESGTDSVLTFGFRPDDPKTKSVSGSTPGTWSLHRWPLKDGPPHLVGSAPGTLAPAAVPDFERDLIVVGQGSEVHLHRLTTFGREPPRVIARSPDGYMMGQAVFDPSAERVAVIDAALNLDLWPLGGTGHEPEVELDSKVRWAAFSPDGSHLATASDSRGADGRLWDLRGPAVAKPLGFDSGMMEMQSVAFSPDSRWLATAGSGFEMALWPLSDRYPRVLLTRNPEVRSEAFNFGGTRPTSLAYAPDGTNLYVVKAMEGVLAWPLSGGAGQVPHHVFRGDVAAGWAAVDPGGRFLLIGTMDGAFKVPVDGGPPDLIDDAPTRFIALSSDGRRAAVRTGDPGILAVVDLETGRRWELEAPGEGKPDQWGYAFDPEGRLLVAKGGVLSRCDYVSGSAEVLLDEGVWIVDRPQGSRQLLLQMVDGGLSMLDLDDGSLAQLTSRDGRIAWDIDPSFEVLVTGHEDGTIRVEPTSGGEAHLLLGHDGAIMDVRLSPDRRWIASLGDDDSIRLWPVPDLSQPPLHTLPRARLIAKLKSLTNLRAVPDEESYTGYSLEPDFTAYQGWTEAPEW